MIGIQRDTYRHRGLLVAAVLMAFISIQVVVPSDARAAFVASDVATVRVGSGDMACSGTVCSFNVSQDLNEPGCVVEVITVAPSTIGTNHQDVYCSMSVRGSFDTRVRNSNKPCTITPSLSPKPTVTFGSGVSTTFNAAFSLDAGDITFTPTFASTTNQIVSGLITVTGIGRSSASLPPLPLTYGQIDAAFTVDFETGEGGTDPITWNCQGAGTVNWDGLSEAEIAVQKVDS